MRLTSSLAVGRIHTRFQVAPLEENEKGTQEERGTKETSTVILML